MDIFNKNRVAELEKKLHETELDRDRYMSKAAELETKLGAVSKLEETIPDDCEKGPWCRSCEFSRAFHYHEYDRYGNWNFEPAYACSKGKSCKHFVERKAEE